MIMATRLSITQLNNFFADDLGDNYAVRSSMSEKPLLLSHEKILMWCTRYIPTIVQIHQAGERLMSTRFN